MIGSKQPTAVYLSPAEAAEHCRQGASIWHFASTKSPPTTTTEESESTADPDVVIAGIGVEVTFETVKAAELLRALCPALRVRVVNVTDLMILAAPESRHYPHALGRGRFARLFTPDRPVLFNYHGYPTELRGLLFGREEGRRVMSVAGYIEEGSTTTPFDMMLVNRVSRFDVAAWALKAGAEVNGEVAKEVERCLGEVEERVRTVREFIRKEGKGEFELCPVGSDNVRGGGWTLTSACGRSRRHLRAAQVRLSRRWQRGIVGKPESPLVCGFLYRSNVSSSHNVQG